MSNTHSASRPWPLDQVAYALVVCSWIIYAVSTLLAPQSTNVRFHMGETQLLLTRLSFIIPIHLIWLWATRSALSFKHYAYSIKGGREAPAISAIANGLLWTIAYLISLSLFGSVLPFLSNVHWLDTIILLRDHIPTAIALVGFILLYRGSQRLKSVANFTTWTNPAVCLMFGFALFAGLFALEFATTPTLPVATRNSLAIAPHEILLFTLVIPHIFTWFLGILSLININNYAKNVDGLLYRQALRNLVRGLAIVVLFMMVYQVIVFAAGFLMAWDLGKVLLLIYALLLIYGLGFFYIRMGAKKLANIEAVQ